MAQAKPEKEQMDVNSDSSSVVPSFKLNVHAPEFVPRSQPPLPSFSGYYYPCFHVVSGSNNGGSDWFYVDDQQPIHSLLPNSTPTTTTLALSINHSPSKNSLSDDLRQKIIKQVEYQFTDMSLLASENLAKHISKDPEGYVPLSVIASSKKIKSITSNSNFVAQAIRSSSKLVVSDDGKKVRRKQQFTDRDKEDLQARVVVAENLPEDYSHRNLERIFSVAGSVQAVRICHPQESNTCRSKADVVISNKLHALVEYETVDQAERAVEMLNDERNWRKGLRVRMLLRRSPRSIIRSRKSEYDHFDMTSDEDDSPPSESLENVFQTKTKELHVENVCDRDRANGEDNLGTGSKKGWARGRGKQRRRAQTNNAHRPVSPSPQPRSSNPCEATMARQSSIPRGPRMPDGTRGFTMGRGKPVTV